jgi:Domain of unknown function (DUF1905)
MKKNAYVITENVWLYPGDMGNWHFVTVTKKYAQEIKENFGGKRRGFGSIPIEATIGSTVWKTSIFPDARAGTYLLPLKAVVRKKEAIEAGDTVTVKIEVCS